MQLPVNGVAVAQDTKCQIIFKWRTLFVFEDRLLFVILVAACSLPVFIIFVVTPRLVVPSVLIVAALHAHVDLADLTIGPVRVTDLILAFVGAIAVTRLFAPKLLKTRTLLSETWRSASRPLRLCIIIFIGMTIIATINTLLRGEPAAGSAVIIAIWFLSLASGFQVPSRFSALSTPSRSFLIKSAMLPLIVSLFGIWLFGSPGHADVVLSVIVLAVFALALTSRFLSSRFAFLFVAAGSTGALFFFFPGSQSLWGGILLGTVWMYIVLFMQRTGKLAGIRKQVAIVILASILVFPVTTILLHHGQHLPIIERGLSWILGAFGETSWNLMNRPARWEVLLAEILRHPFNLRFTNFLDIQYLERPGFTEAAAPHNILITIGVFFGIPGMILAVTLIIALINSLLKAIVHSTPQTRPITLGAFGIVCGFLFRNMWSNALFTWPIEITLFSLAILSAWQAEKASQQTLKQAVSAELQSGPSKNQRVTGAVQNDTW